MNEIPPPSLRQRLRAASAEAMLEGAERIMLEKGYEKTTMQDIAAAAGCAVGTLYLHFETKDELFAAMMQKHAATLSQGTFDAIAPLQDPMEKLRVVIERHLMWVHDHPGLANLLCTALPLRYYDFVAGLDRLLPEEHEKFRGLKLQLLREAQAAGQIRTDFPAEALSELVHGLLLTVLDQFSARPELYSQAQQFQLVWGFITTGLSAPKG